MIIPIAVFDAPQELLFDELSKYSSTAAFTRKAYSSSSIVDWRAFVK